MSSSLSCTLNAYAYYNNGWSGWNTATKWGMGGFGKDRYGHRRIIILKVTTGSFSTATSKKLQIKIPTCRSSAAGAGTDIWYHRITTVVPSLSEGGNTQITLPDLSTCVCYGSFGDVYSPSQSTGYQYQTLTTVEGDFKANTTYYIWMWADTPYVYGYTTYIGYFSHHSSYGGLITVTMQYEEGCVKIHNGTTWVDAIPYVHNGTTWVRAIPYVHNGTTWKIGG